ncbi:hypothetical protein GCM10007897_41530 [Sphingobium jiangsuense]|uniref:Lipoprotein n=1 Tax=Sphingobium jiangsuense TaxID=870476 RepID=A0A7W6BKM3_9SPHN|nr:hypothetical protein [Sphingobium jiangsuense]MBB3928820.1 hypothetical protein [Sphingobium jiangsuense]GLT02731.1 hypothetical protein GCM10007897_41530 [Sphingobium jiangsuense]
MGINDTSRRDVMRALVTTPLIAAPAVAAIPGCASAKGTNAMFMCGPIEADSHVSLTDTHAWDSAMAAYTALEQQYDAAEKEWTIARTRFEAIEPDADSVQLDPRQFWFKEKGYILHVLDIDEEWNKFLRGETRTMVGTTRDEAERLFREQLDIVQTYRVTLKHAEEISGFGAANDRIDSLMASMNEAEAVLLAIPSPHGDALKWKLEQLFGEEAAGGEYTPSWRVDYTHSFFEDIRRFADLGYKALAVPATAQTMLCAPVDLDAAIAEYWRLRAIADNHPYAHALKSDPQYEELLKDSRRACEAAAVAFMRVIDIPSRCGADIGKKIDIVINEYQDFELPNDILERVSADAKRLAA